MLNIQPGIVASQPQKKWDPDVAALFARMTTSPDATRKGLINNLILSLKDAGVWTKLDGLWLMAAHDTQSAELNWIQDQFNLVAVDSPMFVVDVGFKGNGTSSYHSIDGYRSGSNATLLTQDSNNLGMWVLTSDVSSPQADIGCIDCCIIDYSSGGQTIGAGFYNMAPDNIILYQNGLDVEIPIRGYTAMSRTSANSVSFYSAGQNKQNLAVPSSTPSGGEMCIGAVVGPASDQGLFSTERIAAGHAGAALTDAEILALYNGLHTYLSAVGATT